MDARPLLALGIALGSTACSPGVKGTWVGKLDCDAFAWTMQIDLERDGRTDDGEARFVGSAEQARSFENGEGFDATTTISLDVVAVMPERSGVQDLDATFTCVSNVTVVQNPDGTEDTVDACDATRFEDYALTWDGEDRLRLTSDVQNCEGILEVRG